MSEQIFASIFSLLIQNFGMSKHSKQLQWLELKYLDLFGITLFLKKYWMQKGNWNKRFMHHSKKISQSIKIFLDALKFCILVFLFCTKKYLSKNKYRLRTKSIDIFGIGLIFRTLNNCHLILTFCQWITWFFLQSLYSTYFW